MTASIDFCAWCGFMYGEHNGANECVLNIHSPKKWDQDHTFIDLGNLAYGQVPIGSLVSIYLDQARRVAIGPTGYQTVPATIVGHFDDGSVCIAWKDGDANIPANAWVVDSVDHQAHPFLVGWDRARSMYPTYFLHRILRLGHDTNVQPTTVPSGMSCAITTCRVYNEYAQPNHGALHICFSCKSAGYHHIPSLLKS